MSPRRAIWTVGVLSGALAVWVGAPWLAGEREVARADEEELVAKQLGELQAKTEALKAELDRLSGQLAAAEKVSEAQARQLAEQAGRLDELRQRAGMAPFDAKTLTAPEGAQVGMRLDLPKAKRLDARGAKAKASKLTALAKGHDAVVVSWWATWCKPCTSPEELEHLAELRDQLARENVAFVSMAVDGLDDVLADPREATWVYPFWHLDDGHLAMLPRPFVQSVGVGLPLFVVASPDGEIHYWRAKALDDQTVTELVTAAVSLRGR